jgi:XTP/dITP diphosphohydrolase
LRRYLLEETYEVFDAVRGGNADELREELGDVLLQVLFHARIAEDAPHHPFTIDDVADSLVRKLGNRVPAVLAGESISLDEQLAQWEKRKALEKSRNSSMDDVPTGQPALALAQKVLERVSAAGLPADLVPDTITSVTVSVDSDAENALRSAVLEFMDTVRQAEHAIAAGRRGEDVPEELDVATLGEISEEEWRAYLPTAAEAVEGAAEDTEPAPDRIPEPTPVEVPETGPVEVPETGPVEVPEPEPADSPEPSPEDVSTEEALADGSEDADDSEKAAEKFSA